MSNNDPRAVLTGYCPDCDTNYTLVDGILHECDGDEKRRRRFIERQVRTRGGWGPLVVAVVIVVMIAWIIGRMMR